MNTSWLIACGIFMLIEILTSGFLILWLAIGALLAFLVSFLDVPFGIELMVFAVSSSLLIIFMKPILKKFIKINDNPTNKDALIGKTAIVTKEFNNVTHTGQVRVDTETWTALCNAEEMPQVGQKLTVDKIDGVKLIVK